MFKKLMFKIGMRIMNTFDWMIIHEWVLANTNHKQQSSLLSILRGTDAYAGNNEKVKSITRMFRYLIQKEVGKNSRYMSTTVVKQNEAIKILAKEIANNRHWAEHATGAAFIIGRNHPDPYVREYWLGIANVVNWKIRDFDRKVKERARIDSIIHKYENLYLVRGI